MKTAIVIHEDIKQVMFSPENESDKNVLNMFNQDEDISVEILRSSFMEKYGLRVAESQGGYLRAYADENSLMLVIKKKEIIRLPSLNVIKVNIKSIIESSGGSSKKELVDQISEKVYDFFTKK